MKRWTLVVMILGLSFFCINMANAALLDASYEAEYDALLDSMYANGRVVSNMGDRLWVPWMKSSSSCELKDLQNGNACNAGTIDWTHNCMVTDEFSQVGILVAAGDSQARMDAFYNTVDEIQSQFGELPAWRVYRNGNVIEPCKSGINGNCDTASDASARIVIALYTASENPSFTDSARTKYESKATRLAEDMVQYEILKECRSTSQGEICNWLAAGSHARNGGRGSHDFTYTGYYPDAIIAMLAACSKTGDSKYCAVADDLVRNYLLAAKWNGATFTAPPGRSFKWDGNTPVCTGGSCNPPVWDDADASRATGLCQAQHYANIMGRELPGLSEYCTQWGKRHMNNPASAPIQYYTDGSAQSYQSGYFAQGLQALFESGYRPELFKETLDNALAHYSPSTGTWDHTACFGVYHQAFPMRALAFGLGKDEAVFGGTVAPIPDDNDNGDDNGNNEPDTPTNPPEGTSCEVQDMEASCSGTCTLKADVWDGCRKITYTTPKGDIQVLACDKGEYAEVYLQNYPPGATNKICVGDGCVGTHSGFARFAPACTSGPVIEEPTPVDEPAPQEPDSPSDQGKHSISYLKYTCEINGGCSLKSDITMGTCRTIISNTAHGHIKVMACDKGYSVELYRQEYPSNTLFEVCLDVGCVDMHSGFARFKPAYTNADDTNTPTEEPEEPPEEPVIVVDEESSISSLGTSCNVNGAECTTISDTTSGLCRTLHWSSPSGNVKVLTCEKSPEYAEVYLQEFPPGSQTQACVANSCVNQWQGFNTLSY